MEPGTWGEWVGGLVGAIVGGGVPLVLFLLERKDRQVAEDEAAALQSAAEERARTEQVRAVAAWSGPLLEDHPDTPTVFVVQNASALPVFLARAGWVLPEPDPDAFPQLHAERTWEVLRPGRIYPGEDYLPDGVVWCVVTFRDASGTWWARTSTGSYAEVTPEHAADLQALIVDRLGLDTGDLRPTPDPVGGR